MIALQVLTVRYLLLLLNMIALQVLTVRYLLLLLLLLLLSHDLVQ
jgi:hypothetical protein